MLLNSIAMLFQTYTTVDPKQMAFPDQLEDKMGDKLRELEDKPKNQTQHPKQGGHTKNPRHLAMKSVSSTQGQGNHWCSASGGHEYTWNSPGFRKESAMKSRKRGGI